MTYHVPSPAAPSVATPAAPPGVRPDRAAGRWAAACGVLSAVALFVAVASVNIPRNASETEMLAWWRDGDNRAADVVSTFALLASGLLFLGFCTHLVRRVGDYCENAGRLISQAGTAFVVMLFVAGGVGGAVVRGLVVDDEPMPGVDILRFFAQVRYTALGTFAMPAAALVIAVASWAALRHGVLPRWLGWLGIVCTVVIAAATAAFVGQFAIPALLVWTIAASIVFVRPENR